MLPRVPGRARGSGQSSPPPPTRPPAHGYLYLVLLLALAMLGYLVLAAGLDSMAALPLPHADPGRRGRRQPAAGGNRHAHHAGGGSSLVTVSWDFGAFIGLAAAVVAVVPLAAALLRARSSRPA
jgi:hypothetical protein